MKFLGLDYGSTQIGIALTDDEGRIAFPHASIPNDEKAVAFVRALLGKEKVSGIILGDTRTVSGAENPITPSADAFAHALEATGVPVTRMWEAWSSIEASRYAPEGVHSDAAAAAVILQRYLDTKENRIQ